MPVPLQAKFQVIVSPVIRIVPRNVTLPDITADSITGAIFTSAHGVAAVPNPASAKPAWCVGAATTQAAIDAGWAAIQAGKTADELIETLRQSRPRGGVIHFRGCHSRGNVADVLSRAGLRVTERVVYDQPMQPLTTQAVQALTTGPVVAAIFSPRSAQALHQAMVGLDIPSLWVVAISRAAGAPLADLAIETQIAKQPDAAAMGACLSALVDVWHK
jgi:uroporphyrinogen-III synthase